MQHQSDTLGGSPSDATHTYCDEEISSSSLRRWCGPLQGATTFLQSLATSFGDALFAKLPIVKQLMLQPLLTPPSDNPDAKQTADTLQILKIVGPVVHERLFPEVLEAIPAVVQGCDHADHQVRHMTVLCAVELAATHTGLVLPVLLRYLSLCIGYQHCRCCEHPGASFLSWAACVTSQLHSVGLSTFSSLPVVNCLV